LFQLIKTNISFYIYIDIRITEERQAEGSNKFLRHDNDDDNGQGALYNNLNKG